MLFIGVNYESIKLFDGFEFRKYVLIGIGI